MALRICELNFGVPGEHHGSTPLLNDTPSSTDCHFVPGTYFTISSCGERCQAYQNLRSLRNLCFFPKHSSTPSNYQEIPIVQRYRPTSCNLHEPPDDPGHFRILGQPRSKTYPITIVTKYQVACVCRPPGGSQPHAFVWTIALSPIQQLDVAQHQGWLAC